MLKVCDFVDEGQQLKIAKFSFSLLELEINCENVNAENREREGKSKQTKEDSEASLPRSTSPTKHLQPNASKNR